MSKNRCSLLAAALIVMTGLFLSSCVQQIRQLVDGKGKVVQGVFETGETRLPYDLLTYPQVSGKKMPLLVIFHGTGDTGTEYLNAWRDDAEQHLMMVLAPTRRQSFENQEEDLRIFRDLVQQVAQDYPVDADRIYLAGISSGALVARWLLRYYPQEWRGLALIAAPDSLEFSDADPKKLPPILFIHGLRDEQFAADKLFGLAQDLTRKGGRIAFLQDPNAGHEHRREWSGYALNWFETGRLQE